jgi:hypothetical protein
MVYVNLPRHCERSEAIHSSFSLSHGLLRRFAPRNDGFNLLSSGSRLISHHTPHPFLGQTQKEQEK